MSDPYVLPNGVLRNRLTDAAALANAEADIPLERMLDRLVSQETS
ncbi:hypothetical protein [Streptomyces sp. SA15]|nr:hypothetical protein [Streptomyces sp. SA15]